MIEVFAGIEEEAKGFSFVGKEDGKIFLSFPSYRLPGSIKKMI
jgi:hypothetical protein